MKILNIKINDKNYMTGKITAFISKEALKIQRDSLVLAKLGKEIQDDSTDLDKVEHMFVELEEINRRKAWLICEVYQNQFTPDELEKQLSTEEIDAEVNKIIFGIVGVVQKN